MTHDLQSLCAWGTQRVWQIRLPQWDASLFHRIWQHWHDTPASLRPARLHIVSRVAHAQWFLNDAPAELKPLLWGVIPGIHRFRLADSAIHLTIAVGATPDIEDVEHLAPDWWAQTAQGACSPIVALTQRITLIGSGIAGAATARALANVGYLVRVLDAGSDAAAGASGLPAGLVAPHASPDDAPVSRLSRSGIRAMHQTMQALLVQGQDWGATGVTEHRLPGKTRKGGVPAAWLQPEMAASRDWTQPLNADSACLLHPHAAWVKPAQLVKRLLDHPNIHWQGNTLVQRLSHDGAQWWLHLTDEGALPTDQLVLAAGAQTARLLKTFSEQTPPIQPLRGQLSWGLMSEIGHAPLPPTPTNGNGSFIANVPTPEGLAWYVGSTFDRHRDEPVHDEHDHLDNWQRLSALLPETAAALEPLFTQQRVRAWVRIRAAVPDRLPLVGALRHLPAGLSLVSALGSRGLSLGVLCGELLAAQWTGEPLAIEPKLMHMLTAHRFTS